jgi:hypothetical protein
LYRITRISAKKADPLVPANKIANSIPNAVADVLQCAMAVNSSERFVTVQEFWEALQTHVSKVPEPDPQSPGPSGNFSSTTTVAEMLYPSHPASAMIDMPSSASGKVWKGPHPQRNITGQKHVRPLLTGLVVLILIALSSGVAIGSLGLWSDAKHARLLQGVFLTLSKSQPSTPMVPIPTPDTSSARTGHYPSLALSYTGTIYSTLRNMDAMLSLWGIKQDGPQISGYYTIEAISVDNGYYSMQSSFIDSGYFTGKMTINNKIRVLIPSSDSSSPLFFKGQFQPDGSISGTYCSYWHNHCEYSRGKYGNWNVTPQAADR